MSTGKLLVLVVVVFLLGTQIPRMLGLTPSDKDLVRKQLAELPQVQLMVPQAPAEVEGLTRAREWLGLAVPPGQAALVVFGGPG